MLDDYRKAWDSNDPGDVLALFTDDAEYRFHPADEPRRGREQILDAWLESADEPGDHTFDAKVLAIDGELAVVEGRTIYTDGDTWLNLWLIRFAPDGRASSFTEWYMQTDPDAHD